MLRLLLATARMTHCDDRPSLDVVDKAIPHEHMGYGFRRDFEGMSMIDVGSVADFVPAPGCLFSDCRSSVRASCMCASRAYQAFSWIRIEQGTTRTGS